MDKQEAEQAVVAAISVGERFDSEQYMLILQGTISAIRTAHDKMKEVFEFKLDAPPVGRIPGTMDAYGAWIRLTDAAGHFTCLKVLVRNRAALTPGYSVVTSQTDVDGFYMAAQLLMEAYSFVRNIPSKPS